MPEVLHYLQELAISVLVGKVVLLSFVIAPVLARTLDPIPFAVVVRAMFPAYYALGIGAAALGLSSIVALAFHQGLDSATVSASALWSAVLAIEFYCRTPLTPRINALRDKIKQQEIIEPDKTALTRRWERLHKLSVQLNGIVLILGLVLIGLV